MHRTPDSKDKWERQSHTSPPQKKKKHSADGNGTPPAVRAMKKNMDIFLERRRIADEKKKAGKNGQPIAPPVAQTRRIEDVPFVARTKLPNLMSVLNGDESEVLANACPIGVIVKEESVFAAQFAEYEGTGEIAFFKSALADQAISQNKHLLGWFAVAVVERHEILSLFENQRYFLRVNTIDTAKTQVRITNIRMHENNKGAWICLDKMGSAF